MALSLGYLQRVVFPLIAVFSKKIDGGVGIVLLAYSRSQVSVTRPARPEPLSSQTRCFKVQNLTAGLAGVI